MEISQKTIKEKQHFYFDFVYFGVGLRVAVEIIISCLEVLKKSYVLNAKLLKNLIRFATEEYEFLVWPLFEPATIVCSIA